GFDLPVGGDGAGVDGSEAGGGEGDEECRVFGDGVRDAFAADQAGADEVEGVGPVGFGAGGADGGAAVFAGHVEHPVGHVVGDALDLAATIRAVPFGFQAEPDRVGAGAGGGDVGEPGVVVGSADPVQQVGNGLRPQNPGGGAGGEGHCRFGHGLASSVVNTSACCWISVVVAHR